MLVEELVYKQTFILFSIEKISFDDKITFISGNPFVEMTKGVIHLFKQSVAGPVETEIMCMLGVPAKHKTTDLLQLTAPCHQDLEYMRIVHDGSPNQYMVLFKFRNASSKNLNPITNSRNICNSIT